MSNSRNRPYNLNKYQKRLFLRYHKIGSWNKLAKEIKVNRGIIFKYVIYGITPTNPKIRKALGIPYQHRTINDHLKKDTIQEMPLPLLEWAILNREVMP